MCTLRIHTDSGLKTVEVESGSCLLDALGRAHAAPDAPCGGHATCGKCRVRATGALSVISETEHGLLTRIEGETDWRLACLTRIEGDADVWTASGKDAQILVSGANEAPLHFDPPMSLRQLSLPPASLSDQRSDLTRLKDALAEMDANVSLAVLRELPDTARAGADVAAPETAFRPADMRNSLYALYHDDGSGRHTVRAVYAAAPRVYGAAVDIGTTTVAAYLVDLQTGRTLETASALNPQRAHGADVITRCDYSTQPGGLASLQKEICGCVSDLLTDMLRRRGASSDDVKHVVCVGNTVMMHLLAGISPRHIAVTPFLPAFTDALRVEATELGMPFANAVVETAPCVAGYVGADTVSAILACGMDTSDGMNLLIDIGTNGEIALGGRNGLLCCSAAAGPAFEGAHIRCGSGAVSGAISSASLSEDGSAIIGCIGGGTPHSICGSGLVDVIAMLLKAGGIDETGRLDEDEAPESIASRFCNTDSGLSFPLTQDRSVYLCQRDIREVQLAKSAIAAGIEVLMEQAGVGYDDIGKLYLAGGFGNYIDVDAACLIGLLPKRLRERVLPVGNAAGAGAKHILLSREAGDRARACSRSMRYIELSAQKSFTELFSENMLFDI